MTQTELKELLHYDPDTGLFTRLKQTCNSVKIGDVAGTRNGKGYIDIRLKAIKYRASRLAWLYMTGEWPKEQIDHDDRVRHNNKWLNLNEATGQENSTNRSLRKDNTSEVTGVYFCKTSGNWRVGIGVARKLHWLGFFTDKFEAICVRKSAENKYNFHENHGRA